jgi:hypothetical protein
LSCEITETVEVLEVLEVEKGVIVVVVAILLDLEVKVFCMSRAFDLYLL